MRERGSWQASGELINDNGTSLSVTVGIEFQWVPAGMGRVITITANMPHDLPNPPFSGWSFHGLTDHHEPVKAEQMYLAKESIRFNEGEINAILTFSAGEMWIGGREPSLKAVVGYIPDLIISHDAISTVGSSRLLDHTILDLETDAGYYRIVLRSFPEFIGRKSREAVRDNFTVTLEVTRIDCLGMGIEDALSILDAVTGLIGFAAGGDRPWILIEATRTDGGMYTHFRDLTYPVGSAFQVIDVDGYHRLANFLRKALPVYNSWSNDVKKRFRTLWDSIHFASSRLAFPSPFLILGAALEEFMAEEMPDLSNHFIDKSGRESLAPSFEDWANHYVVPLLDKDDVQAFKESLNDKLAGAVSRTLRTRIELLLRSVGMQYPKTWVGEFVKRRNCAAHRVYQFEIDDPPRFLRMLALVQRYCLIRLNYTGEMVVWSVSPPILGDLSEDGLISGGKIGEEAEPEKGTSG